MRLPDIIMIKENSNMIYENIPNNPMMLLSFANTKLRDEFQNLDDMCYDLEVDKREIEEKLSMIDYHYDSSLNRFV